MCARPWLQSSQYGVFMSSSCQKRHQYMLHYLVVACHQGLQVFWRNISPEFFLHWSLCSSTHTTASLQWVLVAVGRDNICVSLSRKYRSRLQTEQDEFQVLRGHDLYVDYTVLGQRRPGGTPAAILLGVENLPSTKTSHFLSVRKEAISLMRLCTKF
jgi:hypothetical protein